MPRDPRVLMLVLRCEELREQGEPPPPEEFCGDCPDLVGEFKQALAELKAIEERLRVLTPLDDGTAPTCWATANGPTIWTIAIAFSGGCPPNWTALRWKPKPSCRNPAA